MATHTRTYICVKCGHNEFETGEFRAAGKFARFVDVQNQKFTTVSCTECGFTEIYKGDPSVLGNILDFAFGG